MTLRWRLAVALALFGVGAGAKWALADQVGKLRARETATLERAPKTFPTKVGEWVGVDIPDDAAMTKTLADIKSKGHLNRLYTHATGEKVILWLNYSDRSLDQYHYPTVCMKGAGWEEDESQRKNFHSEVGPAKRTPMVYFYFSRGPERRAVHYWYYLIGEDPVDRTMRALAPYARAFLRGRQNPSLTVELFSQSPNPNAKLLDEFATLAAKELETWMPPGTESCAELGATY